jgi:hypothetical protein
MSRRPASITQADVARVARVARDFGPPWRVEIEGTTIRLTQDPLPPTQKRDIAWNEEPGDSPFACGLESAP